MQRSVWAFAHMVSAAVIWSAAALGTTVPSLTFEDLVDRSNVVVAGQVTRSWTDWDSNHQFIWTHYELEVWGVYKGSLQKSLVISEPGGEAGGVGMQIPGSVRYESGEQVVAFLESGPGGKLRTTGWGQGKYPLDSSGHIHADRSLRSLEVVSAREHSAAGTALQTLDGMNTRELSRRIALRVQRGGVR